jgi:hypothetical protein
MRVLKNLLPVVAAAAKSSETPMDLDLGGKLALPALRQQVPKRPDEVAGEARLELAIAVLETGALAAKLHSPSWNWHRLLELNLHIPVHSGALCH